MNQLAFSVLGTPENQRSNIIKKIIPHIDRIHWDFMDNTFVPFKGLPIFDLKKPELQEIPVDIHLMVDDPYKYLKEIDKTDNHKIDIVIGQIEVLDDPRDFIDTCRSYGWRGGIAINPESNPEILEPYIFDADCILILGVTPGKSGQKMIPHTLNTLQFIREQREEVDIIFDGGANPENSNIILEKGANIIVSGGFLQTTTNLENARNFLLGE